MQKTNKKTKLKKIDLVVFDFDGTLSAHDCNMQFGKYCFRHSIRPWFFTPVILSAFIASLFNKSGFWWREKSRCFLTQKMVKKFAPKFIKQHKQERFGWAAEQVAAEKEAGNIVILISAGTDYLVPKLAKDMGFDAIITSQTDSTKPWKLKFSCWGENKVVALKKWAALNNYDYNFIRSYSDSKSDMPLMKLANEQVWIHPITGMRLTKPV